jgi:large subunit ribosomal protein L22
MPTVTAQLNNYRQSPRKVRIVARELRGQNAKIALTKLNFIAKRSASPLGKLLASAIANAKNKEIETENLFIKEIRVDNGAILYRRRSASRGRAPSIHKRTSHIMLVLETKEPKSKKPATNNLQPTKKSKKGSSVVGGKPSVVS